MEFAFSNSIQHASEGMKAQSYRMRIVSENLSNTDTPGYHRKQLQFSQVYDAQSGRHALQAGNVSLDRREGERIFDPGHPLADADGYVEMSNVNMMMELADAQQASRSYEANLSTFKQAIEMYQGLIDILRR